MPGVVGLTVAVAVAIEENAKRSNLSGSIDTFNSFITGTHHRGQCLGDASPHVSGLLRAPLPYMSNRIGFLYHMEVHIMNAKTAQTASCRWMHRMTRILGLTLSLLLLLSLCLTGMTLNAGAAAPSVSEADGLTVSILTDKDTYESGDEVHILITIQNSNLYDVEGLSIDTLIPNGFLLRTGAESYSDITVPAGEVYEATIITLYVQEEETTAAPETTGAEEDTTSDAVGADTNLEQPEDTTPETEADDGESIVDSILTALRENAVLRYVLIGVVAAIALIIVIVVIVKRISMNAHHFCFFLAIVLLLQVAAPVISAIEPNDTSVEVQTSVTFNGEPVDLAATVTWKKDAIITPEVDNSTYTRGEWIEMLAEQFGITANTTIAVDQYFYGDSVDSPVGPLVETFRVLGALPAPDSEGYEDPDQDIPLFEADRLVTREYAAYTIAHLLGFEGEYACEVADADALTYPHEVGVMLMLNFFVPDASNRFLPEAYMTAYDALRATNRIRTYLSEEEPDGGDGGDGGDSGDAEAEDNRYIAFQQGVLHIQNHAYTVTEQENEVYLVTLNGYEDPSSLTEGRIIVLSPSEATLYEYAFKLVSVEEENGTLTLTCTKPELEEVLLEINYSAPVDPSEIEVTGADGVIAEYDPNGSMDVGDEANPFDLNFNDGISGTFDFEIDKELGDSGVTVKGTVSVAFPQISARVRGKVFGGFSFDEVKIALTQEIGLEAALEYDFGIPEHSYDILTGEKKFGTGKTEIGRASFPLGVGLHADIVFFINFDVSGQISISYELEGVCGLQYKDQAFRAIKDYTTEFNTLEINAEAKLGIGLSPRISLFSVFDLIGLDLHGGLGVYGGFVMHDDFDPTLYCGDLTVYFYLTLEISEDTLLVQFLQERLHLKITWSLEIFDKDNSPLRLNLHIENGQRVEECSYGKGGIFGIVKSASTGEPIGGARVYIYNVATGALVTNQLTERTDLIDSDLQLYRGEFKVSNLPVGLYRVDVLATGYQAYSIQINVTDGDEPVVCEAALMLLRAEIDGNGFVEGNVINALTGMPLEDTTCYIRKGWNMTDGEALYELSLIAPSFSVELAPGNYTLQLVKDDFIDSFINVVVKSNEVTLKDISVSPKQGVEIQSGGFRVVLTWGEYPLDLDSYLICRDTDGNMEYYTYYNDQSYYKNGNLIANLDVDDRYSYGPETSTVYEITEGSVYSFWVHDYSNRNDYNTTALSYSGAQVKLYSGEVLLATFNIMENREGTLWRVFEYDSATGKFTYLNEMDYMN